MCKILLSFHKSTGLTKLEALLPKYYSLFAYLFQLIDLSFTYLIAIQQITKLLNIC